MLSSAPRGALILSDIHPGRKREDEKKHRKLNAVSAFLQYAVDDKLRLRENGDGLDNRPDRKKMGKERAEVRDMYEQTRITDTEYMRGNHDAEKHFSDAQVYDLVGDVTLIRELIRKDPQLSVMITHGHVLDTKRSMELILRVCREAPDNLTLMSEKNTNEHMMDGTYKLGETMDQLLGILGINADQLWDRCDRSIRQFRRALAGLLHDTGKKKRGTLLETIGQSLDEQIIPTSAKMAEAAGVPMIVMGHTHAPRIDRVKIFDPETELAYTVLSGNSGSFVSNIRPTALHVEDPGRMILLEYHKSGIQVLDEQSLTENELINNAAILAKRKESRRQICEDADATSVV